VINQPPSPAPKQPQAEELSMIEQNQERIVYTKAATLKHQFSFSWDYFC
tara:strand:+ start:1469 stop:1615 length:147 start_codon:yes stop_codon:yes gene_type:complete